MHDMVKEQIWLEKLSLGDEKAYKLLFEGYYASLVTFACKFMIDKVMAEDMVQDSIYEFWKKRKKFESLLALKAYLYTSVRNQCFNYLEHDKVKMKYLAEVGKQEEHEFFLSQIIEEEVYLGLKKAIDSLPRKIRTIYNLLLAGHSNLEIAEIMGLTEEAVKAYRKRGKKLLKDKLQHLFCQIICLLLVYTSRH